MDEENLRNGVDSLAETMRNLLRGHFEFDSSDTSDLAVTLRRPADDCAITLSGNSDSDVIVIEMRNSAHSSLRVRCSVRPCGNDEYVYVRSEREMPVWQCAEELFNGYAQHDRTIPRVRAAGPW
jgi:hypothetical protein